MSPLTHSLGLIDLGSNSVRLMIVRYLPRRAFKITHEFSRRVRLSEGMGADAHLNLQPAAITRTLNTLAKFKAVCAAQGVQQVVAVATAATRDAGNRAEFLHQVTTRTGLELKILSGEEEAYFSSLGVSNTLGLRTGLVLEVGGGSAQVGQLAEGQFKRGVTRPLGAVRLTEAFLKSNPVTSAELRQLSEHVEQLLEAIDWMHLRPGGQLAGVGGTLRALARIDRVQRGYPLDLVNGYELELEYLETLLAQLAGLPVAERVKQVPGLQSDRADIILAGVVVVVEALRRAGTRQLIVCGHGLREGLFFREFFKPAAPLVANLREFSVLNLARLCEYEEKHAAQVTRLALALFDGLRSVHHLGAPERELLWAAGQLHEIGALMNYADPHKHSAQLIVSQGLFGYSHSEVAQLALVCLALRGEPLAGGGVEAQALERVMKLAALLRLADALEISHTQTVREVETRVTAKRVLVKVVPRREASWELQAAEGRAAEFSRVFERELEIEIRDKGL